MNNQLIAKHPADEHGARIEQYLTFMLGQKTFAMPIQNICEIIAFDGVTPVPLMPVFLRGVINLRGSIVPVIDLSARFGDSPLEVERRTCVVIVEVEDDSGMIPIGVIVDAVNEVVDIPPEAIAPPPAFGTNIQTAFISGMFSQDDRFVIILNHQCVLSLDEMAGLAEQDLDRIPTELMASA